MYKGHGLNNNCRKVGNEAFLNSISTPLNKLQK